MTAESVWGRLSDQELVSASERLHEYTNVGQAAIAAELARRGMPVDRDRFEAARAPDDPADSDGPAQVEEVQPARPLLHRLWRGEVRLVVTYWGWGFCGNLVLAFAFLAVQRSGSEVASATWALIAATYTFFIMVAIWRSAGRYQGFFLWALMAKVAIVVSILRAVGALFVGA